MKRKSPIYCVVMQARRPAVIGIGGFGGTDLVTGRMVNVAIKEYGIEGPVLLGTHNGDRSLWLCPSATDCRRRESH